MKLTLARYLELCDLIEDKADELFSLRQDRDAIAEELIEDIESRKE